MGGPLSDNSIVRLSESESSRYIWRRLKRYQDTELTFDILRKKHAVPPKNHKHLLNQCQQISYSIAQAHEFSMAAESSGLATRGLQSYYALTSLANLEILWIGTGEVSFDRRGNSSRSHGFSLHPGASILEYSAKSNLSGIGEEAGLFGLWRRHSRHLPDYGKRTREYSQTSETGYEAFSSWEPLRNFEMKPTSISLGECLSYLPEFQGRLSDYGLTGRLVRITRELTVRHDEEGRPTEHVLHFAIHPCLDEFRDMVIDNYRFPADWLGNIKIFDARKGAIFNVTILEEDERGFFGPEMFPFSSEISYIPPDGLYLNEFGYYYVGLYICSMISRYHPQDWIREIGKNSQLTFLVDDFVGSALRRIPLLALSQIEDRLHVYS